MKISKQWKKRLEISFYTSVPKIMISYPVTEIWHVSDVIVIFHFGQCLALLPPNSPKNENFKTMEKRPGYIIILHKYTKNHDHMLYCSWDIVHEGCNCYFSFWAIFPLLPPNSPKNENLKKNEKRKKAPGGIILHKCTKNHDHMLYCSWDIVYERCHYFSFWAILPFYRSNSLKKSKFQKNEKSAWRDHHFTHVYQRRWLDDIWFLRYGTRQMDGWTDGQKK